jgi:tetratricopeptide (TPR) repeat protein
LKRSHAMLRSRIVKAASSFSLLLLVGFALAQPAGAPSWQELERRLETATPEQALALLEERPDDPRMDRLREALANKHASPQAVEAQIRAYVRAQATAERAVAASADQLDPAQQVRDIQRNPLYRDPGIRDESNWLSRALRRVAELFSRPAAREVELPNMPQMGGGGWLIYAMWGILGALLLVFLYLAARHFAWKRRLTRRSKAILEEDEPDRSLDEWLALADRLEQEGRYREAVRCLYLACLLKFDEHRIARFERGQTNWEHLHRIEATAEGQAFGFREPTQKFDRIWYGFQGRGQEDVTEFRAWYLQLSAQLSRRAA